MLDMSQNLTLIFHLQIILIASEESDKRMTLKNDLSEGQFLLDGQFFKRPHQEKAFFLQLRVMNQRIIRGIREKLVFIMLRQVVNIRIDIIMHTMCRFVTD